MKTTLLNRLSTILFVFFANAIFAQDLWTPSVTDGFGAPSNYSIKSMLVFKGNLYAGAGDDTAAIYSTSTGNAGSWQRKFSSSNIYGIGTFAATTEGGGYMYASTGYPFDVYRTSDGNTWTPFYTAASDVKYMAAFKGLGTVDLIYTVEAGINGDIIKRAAYNSNDPGDTLGTWQTVADFNILSPSAYVTAIAVYNGKLYIGVNDGSVWSTPDGSNWTQNPYVGYGFGGNGAEKIAAMGIYDGYLYATVYNSMSGAEIWRSNDDTAWNMVAQFPPYREVTSFAVNGTDLWATLDHDGSGVGEVVKSTDGLTFTLSENNGFGYPGNNGSYGMVLPFGNNMYYSTQNYTETGGKGIAAHSWVRGNGGDESTGGQIWRTCLGSAPVIDLGSDQTICAGQTVILDAGPGTAYYWNDATITETNTVAGTLVGTQGYYSVIVTGTNGCDGTDTIHVTSYPQPLLSVVTPYTQHAVVCAGDSLALLNTASPNFRDPLTAVQKNTNMPILDSQTSEDTLAISGVNDMAAAALLSVTIDSLTHTYDADMTIKLIAPDGSVTMLSDGNGSGEDNYFGTVFTSTAPTLITDGVAPFTGQFQPQEGFSSFSGPADGNWRIQVTDNASGDEGVLTHWTLQFSVADTILYFSWGPITGLSSHTILNPTVTPPSGTTVYTMTATNSYGCIAQLTDTIVVPAIHMTVSDDSICSGGSILLSVTGAVNPTWSPAAELSSTSGTTVTGFPSGNTTYYVSDSVSGCYTQDSVAIFMDNLLTLSTTPDQTICHGDSATIAGIVTGGTAPFTYSWTNGSTSLSQNVSPASTTGYMIMVSDAYGCANTSTTQVAVNPSTDIYGHVTYSGGNIISSNVVIYKYEPFLVHFDTVQVSTTDAAGYYHFAAIDHHTYLIEVFPAASYPGLVPTYYGNSFLWDAATIVTHDCVMADTFNISATEEVSFGTGPGYLHGRIVKGPGYGAHPGYPTYSGGHERIPGEPIPGIDVKLGHNPGGQMVTSTTTDGNGEYSFANVAFGNYTVYADVPGLGRDSSYTFTVDSANTNYNYLNYEVDSTTIHYIPDAGVGVQALTANVNRLNVYPNPSKGDATIEYSIDKESEVSLGIYNVLGVKVRELANAQQQAGTYKYNINEKGSGLDSGVYFVTLIANGKTSIRRIVVTE